MLIKSCLNLALLSFINKRTSLKVVNQWLKSKIPDLSHYQNFYEFPIKSLNYLVIICFDP